MTRRTFTWLTLAAVALAGLLSYRYATLPSDRELIATALQESIRASKEGRPGGVLDHLSNSIRLNDVEYVRFQREVADAIRRLRPDVEILNPAPTITGDTAVITSAITLSTKLPPLSMTVPQVSIEFRRENAREWLVLPASKWRVVGVDVPEEVVQSLQMPF